MMRHQSLTSSVTRQRKSSQCRRFEPIKNGTAMAQGLPLTSWAGGAETPATQPRTRWRAGSQANCRWEDLDGQRRTARQRSRAPDVPLRLPIGCRKLGVWTEVASRGVQFGPMRGVLTRLPSNPVSDCSLPLRMLGSQGLGTAKELAGEEVGRSEPDAPQHAAVHNTGDRRTASPNRG
jgi:hypothetical protein